MRRRAALVAIVLAGFVTACGLRTAVRPPEDTAPVVSGEVTAVRDKGIVLVRWKRAERSVDGQRVEDLSTFLVERRRADEEFWQHVATIDVVDQEKIRRRGDFSWRDTEAASGKVSYRVRAVCADGQEGAPVEVVTTDRVAPAPVASVPVERVPVEPRAGEPVVAEPADTRSAAPR